MVRRCPAIGVGAYGAARKATTPARTDVTNDAMETGGAIHGTPGGRQNPSGEEHPPHHLVGFGCHLGRPEPG